MPGLTILSDTTPRRLTQIARDLEANRRVLLSVLGVSDFETAIPSEVFAFRRNRDLATYHRTADGSPTPGPALSVRDRRGRLLAFSLEETDEVLPIVRRILAEDLLDQILPRPPSWVRSGLATTFAALEPGDPPAELADSRQTRFAAPASLWPPVPGLPTDRAKRDTISAALTRYLLQPQSSRSSQYRRYLILLRGRTPDVLAFEESFGILFEFFYQEAKAAAARGYRLHLALPVPGELETPTPDDASRAEVDLALGDLVARSAAWNTVAAALHYSEIASDSALAAAATRGEAFLRDLDRRHQDAVELYEASLASNPTDTTTALLLGWSLLDRFRREVGTVIGREKPMPPEIAKARSLFETASLADPLNPHLQHGLGATYLFAAVDPGAGISALEKAHDLLPNDTSILADWILALARVGRGEEARALLRERLGPVAPAELVNQTVRFLLEEDLERVTKLLRDGDLEAAETILRAAREGAGDAETIQDLEAALEQIELLRHQVELDDQIDRFQTAVEEARLHAQAGDIPGARDLIEPFLEPEVDDDVRAAAVQVLGEINALRP